MRPHRLLPTLALVAIAGAARADQPATGPDKMACIQAHGDSQVLRRDEKLIESRKKLVECSNASCPGVIQQECGQWLAEVDKAIPTVVVQAHRDGAELGDVRVLVDGSVRAEKLDGKPLAVDPGVHVFRYESGGVPAIEQKLTIHAGEKDRRIAIDFTPAATAAAPASSEATPSDAAAPARRGIPTTAYVLGGVGVVSLGAFTYFGLAGNGKKSDLEACKPNCADGDVSAVRRDWTIANVALGVGVVSLGVATYLALTGSSSPSSSAEAARGPSIDVQASGSGGAITLRSRF